jgi:hypothetical protein
MKFAYVSILAALLVGPAAAQPTTAPAAATEPSGPLRFGSFGVSILQPAGWHRVTAEEFGPDGSATVAAFARESRPAAVEQLAVELGAKIGSPDAPSLRAWAESLSRLRGMQILPNEPKLAGRAAIDLVAPAPTDATAKLVRGRLCEHGGYGLCVWLFTADPHPDFDAFDALCNGVTVNDPSAPADALSAGERWIGFPPRAGLAVNLPDPFRMFSSNDDLTEVKFNTFDFRKDRSDCEVVIDLIDPEGGATAALRAQVAENLKRATGATAEWNTIDLPNGISVSWTAPLPLTEKEDGVTRVIQAVLARRKVRSVAVMSFAYPQDEMGVYDKLVTQRLIPTIRPAGQDPTPLKP